MKKDYIFDVIKNSPNSLTAEEIYNNVSQNININLSTVYRTLNNLVEKDLVTKIVRQDKISYYELADNDQKHYLICDKCNQAFSTDMCNIEKIERKIKRETGFNITSHTLEFHGICPECSKNAK
mgnify:FL=1